MFHRKTDCPWCGNQVTVAADVEPRYEKQRCIYCNRCIKATMIKVKGKYVLDVTGDEYNRQLYKK